jgi:hypothetical protein
MTVGLSPVAGAGWQFFDSNGVPLAGGRLYTYAAGSTTPETTYTSSTGATANSNPIILDSAGRVSGTTEVWLTITTAYKFVLKTDADVQLWSADDISGIAGVGNPLPVSSGGTGRATATAYAVVCGGTTATGALQSVASVGTTGQVLTSNGVGALPTMQSAFLTGMIILWYGTVATIPTGWVLCNGSNSTPDLRNKFVIAADADSGGAAKTTVTGTATQSGGSADLVVVSHTHVATDAGHTHLQQSNTLLSGGAGAVRNDLSVYQISSGGTTQSGTANITNAVPAGSVAGTNQNYQPYITVYMWKRTV